MEAACSPNGTTEVSPQCSDRTIGAMDDFVVAGVLLWLTVFAWWGTDLVLRSGNRAKLVGGVLIAVGVVPALIALWLVA